MKHSGCKGWETMERTADYIPATHFKIADAKRGDIGNTSAQYAKAFFDTLKVDAITVAPYMGEDSIRPFLEHKDKWTIILGLTSNSGAKDFELKKILSTNDTLEEGIHITHSDVNFLYETVLKTTSKWGSSDNTMYVVGATQPEEFVNIRSITPDHFYLVPGVGAQGGSLKEVSQKALIKDCGLLINVSRAVVYASNAEDFADEASIIAQRYADEMSIYL